MQYMQFIRNSKNKIPGWFIGGALLSLIYSLLQIISAANLESNFGAALLYGYTHILPIFVVQKVFGQNDSLSLWFLAQAIGIVLIFTIGAGIGYRITSHRPTSPYLIPIWLIVLIGLVLGSEFYFRGPYGSRCENLQEEFMRDGCYSDIAAFNDDSDTCDKISKPEVKNLCYSGIAARQADKDICINIPDEDERTTCVAVATGDASLCLELPEQRLTGRSLRAGVRSGCVAGAASKKHDSSLCDLLIDSIERNRCHSTVYYSTN